MGRRRKQRGGDRGSGGKERGDFLKTLSRRRKQDRDIMGRKTAPGGLGLGVRGKGKGG